MLWLVERVFFGPLKEPHHDAEHPIPDMHLREVFALVPLVVFMFWIGLHPQFFVEKMQPTLNPLAASAGAVFDDVMKQRTAGVISSDTSSTGDEIARRGE
jgi:NADH:ubiquinone oxidoreductase subunit 4 (subunit M)